MSSSTPAEQIRVDGKTHVRLGEAIPFWTTKMGERCDGLLLMFLKIRSMAAIRETDLKWSARLSCSKPLDRKKEGM